MSEVNELVNIDEIVRVYVGHPVFAQLRDDLRTQQGAYDWFRVMNSLGVKGVNYYWSQIPLDLMTDALRRLAITHEVEMLVNIDPPDAKDYSALCQFAYEISVSAAQYIHVDYRTEATVAAMIKEPRNFTFSFLENPWIGAVMTPQMTEAASLGCHDFMSILPVSQISQAALDKHLGTGYVAYRLLHDEGKLRLAADFLRAGRWPAPPGGSAKVMEKPQSLAHALERMLEDEWEELYMAYVMTFPVEDVVPLIGRKHVEKAMQMYTTEELRPVMKMNRHLKAALLEESLGL